LGIPQCVVHSLYRSSTRGPEDDSVESKHLAPLLHYMFNFTTVVFEEIKDRLISWSPCYFSVFPFDI